VQDGQQISHSHNGHLSILSSTHSLRQRNSFRQCLPAAGWFSDLSKAGWPSLDAAVKRGRAASHEPATLRSMPLQPHGEANPSHLPNEISLPGSQQRGPQPGQLLATVVDWLVTPALTCVALAFAVRQYISW
jgi:hypothetical protein